MHPDSRTLLKIKLPREYQDRAGTKDLIERLMGKHPEHRFRFIQDNAADVDRDTIDA
jgi:topoisomerase-4 subunit B